MSGPNEIALRVQGLLYDAGSWAITIDDDKYDGIVEVTYGQKRERAQPTQQGGMRLVLGKTRGKVTYDEVKVKMYAQTYADLRLNLATKTGGLSYGDRIFNMSLVATGPGLPPLNDQINFCSIASDTGGLNDSVDASVVDVSIQCGFILRDGLLLGPAPF